MNVSVVMNAHDNPALILDSVESIIYNLTEKIVVLIDGAAWPKFRDVQLPVSKVEGFRHGAPKAPFRNMALGLKTVRETWPDSDWYCYCEPDVLFASPRIKQNLKMAEERGVWMLGNDGHVDDVRMPLVESLIGSPFRSCYYLLGCCQFFHKDFMTKLFEIDFFEKFLSLTNGFPGGDFPLYKGYDISEHMYPSLCRQFGGNVGVFAHYDEHGKWHGAYEHFPMRWKPELDPETESFPEASIMHPVKDLDSPLRDFHRKKRRNESIS